MSDSTENIAIIYICYKHDKKLSMDAVYFLFWELPCISVMGGWFDLRIMYGNKTSVQDTVRDTVMICDDMYKRTRYKQRKRDREIERRRKERERE